MPENVVVCPWCVQVVCWLWSVGCGLSVVRAGGLLSVVRAGGLLSVVHAGGLFAGGLLGTDLDDGTQLLHTEDQHVAQFEHLQPTLASDDYIFSLQPAEGIADLFDFTDELWPNIDVK